MKYILFSFRVSSIQWKGSGPNVLVTSHMSSVEMLANVEKTWHYFLVPHQEKLTFSGTRLVIFEKGAPFPLMAPQTIQYLQLS